MLDKLKALVKTMNFESAASSVFGRLLLGQNPGLMVLWGGNKGGPKVNKTYFLDMIEGFQDGLPPGALGVLPSNLTKLLISHPKAYQCVRVEMDSGIPQNQLFETPLALLVPLAIARAGQRRGLVAGRRVVILCDDLDEHMRSGHSLPNEAFLKELSKSLDLDDTVTFIGTSRLSWDAKGKLGYDRALALGWD
jgi:hypothetical protein